MNIVDLVIVVATVLGVYTGIKRGLIRILIDVLSMGLSIYVAMTYQERFAALLYAYVPLSSGYLTWVSFGALWCLTFAVMMGVGSVLHRLLSFSIFGPLNLVGGMVLGVVRNIVFIIPILMVFAFFDAPMLEESSLYKPMKPSIQYLIEDVIPEKLDALKKKGSEGLQQSQQSFQDVVQEKIQDNMPNLDEGQLDSQSLDQLIQDIQQQ